MNRSTKILALSGVFLIAIQFVPYGREYDNPKVRNEPRWNSQATRELVRRACFDCHSNDTVWPWYSKVAPISWLVFYDVKAGRGELNFSEWANTTHQIKLTEIVREIAEGGMPPLQYRLGHASARLSETDKQALIDGLQSSL